MKMMKYRTAKHEDLKQIIEMKNRVKQRIELAKLPMWLNGYPTDEFLTLDVKDSFGRVIELDGKVVAYAVLYPSYIEYENEIENIVDLYSFGRVMVDDNYTGKGIGRYLVENMIMEAKSHNQKGMLITGDDFNTKAMNLYKSLGFVKIGEKQFSYAYLSIFKLIF
jgi:GNAT superfamily N-acetyltransferase